MSSKSQIHNPIELYNIEEKLGYEDYHAYDDVPYDTKAEKKREKLLNQLEKQVKGAYRLEKMLTHKSLSMRLDGFDKYRLKQLRNIDKLGPFSETTTDEVIRKASGLFSNMTVRRYLYDAYEFGCCGDPYPTISKRVMKYRDAEDLLIQNYLKNELRSAKDSRAKMEKALDVYTYSDLFDDINSDLEKQAKDSHNNACKRVKSVLKMIDTHFENILSYYVDDCLITDFLPK